MANLHTQVLLQPTKDVMSTVPLFLPYLLPVYYILFDCMQRSNKLNAMDIIIDKKNQKHFTILQNEK